MSRSGPPGVCTCSGVCLPAGRLWAQWRAKPASLRGPACVAVWGSVCVRRSWGCKCPMRTPRNVREETARPARRKPERALSACAVTGQTRAGTRRSGPEVQGRPGRGGSQGGVCALTPSRRGSVGSGQRARGTRLRPISAEIAWGRTQAAARRAAVGGGPLGRAQREAPPSPVRGWAGGLIPAAAAAPLQVTGGRGLETRGAHWGRRPSGKPGAETGRCRPGQIALEAEAGAPPQGHQAGAASVPGVAGPSPPARPPLPKPGCARAPAGPVRRVPTRKRGSGTLPPAASSRRRGVPGPLPRGARRARARARPERRRSPAPAPVTSLGACVPRPCFPQRRR